MPGFLPRMPLEPPREYVAFVAQHLDVLRHEAGRVVGDVRDADLLYPAVLTEVATRWRWLELARTRLHREGAADHFLRRAFARRAGRWTDDGATPVEVRVYRADDPQASAPDTGAARELSWPRTPGAAGPPIGTAGAGGAGASVALRMAPHVRTAPRTRFEPRLEAAVAWWHAYEEVRRRRLIALLAAVVVLCALLARAHRTLTGAGLL